MSGPMNKDHRFSDIALAIICGLLGVLLILAVALSFR